MYKKINYKHISLNNFDSLFYHEENFLFLNDIISENFSNLFVDEASGYYDYFGELYFDRRILENNKISSINIEVFNENPSLINNKKNLLSLNRLKIGEHSIAIPFDKEDDYKICSFEKLECEEKTFPKQISFNINKNTVNHDIEKLNNVFDNNKKNINSSGLLSKDIAKKTLSLNSKLNAPIELSTPIDKIHNAGFEFIVNTFIKKFRFNFYIPISKLNANTKKIFIKITPISSSENNTINNSKLFVVNHRDSVYDLITPTMLPSIDVISKRRGYIKLKITQNDLTANKITITKKNSSNDLALEHVSTLNLNHGESEIIEDLSRDLVYPNKVVYYFTPQMNDLSGPSQVYEIEGTLTSSTITSVDGIDIKNSLAIYAENKKDNIEIKLDNIHENIDSLILLRENLNEFRASKFKNIIIKKDNINFYKLNNSTSKTVTFNDYNVVDNAKYRYYCKVYTKNRKHFFTISDSHIIRKKPINKTELPFDISFKDKEFYFDDLINSYVFNVELTKNSKNNVFQSLRDIFVKQNIAIDFLEDLEKNRDELNDLLVFRVDRYDYQTGRTEFIKIHESGVFTDVISAQEFVNKKYKYIFKPSLIPPTILFSGAINLKSSGLKPGIKDIKYLAKKFDNYNVKNRGTLTSDAELNKKIDIENLVNIGDTGINLNIDVEVIKPKTDFLNLSTRILPNKKIKIEFSVNDEDNTVHYFKLFAVVNGINILLNKFYKSVDSNKFVYIDDKISKIIGNKFYVVKSFSFNDVLLNEAKSNSISKISNDDFMLKLIVDSSARITGTSRKDLNPEMSSIKLSEIKL